MEECDTMIHQNLLNNHAECVLASKASVAGPMHYMPHHAIICRDREITKVHIVSNASSKAPGEIPFNGTLHIGPNLNPDMLGLLLQFRDHHIALTADAEKAFLQARLDPRRVRFASLPVAWDYTQGRSTPSTHWSMEDDACTVWYKVQYVLTCGHHMTSPRVSSVMLPEDFSIPGGTLQHAWPGYNRRFWRRSRHPIPPVQRHLPWSTDEIVKWTSNDITLQNLLESEDTNSQTASSLMKVLGLGKDNSIDEI